MYNANSFVNSSEYSEDNFTTCPEDRPLVVQFASHEPEVLLRAAKLVEDKCDAVDINLGCPQAIAKRGRYGAWLMEELDLLTELVSILAKNLKIPVTCKTRIYKDFDRSVRLCETLVNAGASMLTIHGRTREQKGQLCGG
jgi:tRNA-dihydrouridine synthase 1